jgi:hypothetical protein
MRILILNRTFVRAVSHGPYYSQWDGAANSDGSSRLSTCGRMTSSRHQQLTSPFISAGTLCRQAVANVRGSTVSVMCYSTSRCTSVSVETRLRAGRPGFSSRQGQ